MLAYSYGENVRVVGVWTITGKGILLPNQYFSPESFTEFVWGKISPVCNEEDTAAKKGHFMEVLDMM